MPNAATLISQADGTTQNLTSLGEVDYWAVNSASTIIRKTDGGSLITVNPYTYDTYTSGAYVQDDYTLQSWTATTEIGVGTTTTTDGTPANLTASAYVIYYQYASGALGLEITIPVEEGVRTALLSIGWYIVDAAKTGFKIRVTSPANGVLLDTAITGLVVDTNINKHIELECESTVSETWTILIYSPLAVEFGSDVYLAAKWVHLSDVTGGPDPAAVLTGTAMADIDADDLKTNILTVIATLSDALLVAESVNNLQFVGRQTSGFVGSTTNRTITFALTGGIDTVPRDGDLVLIGFAIGTAARTPTLIIEATSGVDYTMVGSQLAADDTYDTLLAVGYKVMGGTPDTQVRFSCSATGGTGNAADAGTYDIRVYRGVDPTTPFDGVTSTTATGNNSHAADPPSITPSTVGATTVHFGAGAAATGANFTSSDLSEFGTFRQNDTNDSMIGGGHLMNWTSGAVNPAAFGGGGAGTTADSWCARSLVLRPLITTPFADAAAAARTGMLSDGSETDGFNAEKGSITFARTADNIITATLAGFSGYSITAQEEVEWTLPASILNVASPIIAAPTFTIDPSAGGTTYNVSLADTLNASDSANSLAILAASIADALSASDSIGSLAVLNALVSDVLDASDAVMAVAVSSVLLADTVNASDEVVSSFVLDAAIEDSLTVTDSISVSITLNLALADTLVASDALSSVAILVAAMEDTLTFGDDVTSSISNNTYDVDIDDALTVSDATDTTMTYSVSLEDTATVTDLMNANMVMTVGLADNLTASDAMAVSMQISAVLSDYLDATDTLASTKTHYLTIEDALTLSDAISNLSIKNVVIADTLTASDLLSASTIFSASIADTLIVSDNAEAGFLYAVALSDELSFSDVISSAIIEALFILASIGFTARHRSKQRRAIYGGARTAVHKPDTKKAIK